MSYQFLGPNLVRVYNESSSVVFKPSQFCASQTSKRDPMVLAPITTVDPFIIISCYSGMLSSTGAPALNTLNFGLDDGWSSADAVSLSGDVYTAVNDYLESIA